MCNLQLQVLQRQKPRGFWNSGTRCAFTAESPDVLASTNPSGRALRATKTPRAQSPGLSNGGRCAPESLRTLATHSPRRTRFPTLLHGPGISLLPTQSTACLWVTGLVKKHKRSGHDQCKRLQNHIVPRRTSRHSSLIAAPIHGMVDRADTRLYLDADPGPTVPVFRSAEAFGSGNLPSFRRTETVQLG
jgi:hypothetical protein